ncbi:hypothetical protein Pmani_009293 [Petrolisthes manimaculis]|uniref:Uncharacterized protein n=1 Tax=Petrolisthes manimaculis TaxID=1843537 RepID=A0AAE1Q4K5_9EUCA|nr:hypothetical protein Pmani_009293 [Petrolisthes manimaculis]
MIGMTLKEDRNKEYDLINGWMIENTVYIYGGEEELDGKEKEGSVLGIGRSRRNNVCFTEGNKNVIQIERQEMKSANSCMRLTKNRK